MMKEMQANPESSANDCFDNTADTNILLLEQLDFPSYSTGQFDVGIFLTKTQVMNLKFAEQLESCGYNKFLIAFDTFANNIP
mmetsp:Transcript_35860/g.43836  ORF Transcript_35860/g.43836 Transcript_35860/m.43836 type:complete len:82 (+) Transcript_35860:233-478(+)